MFRLPLMTIGRRFAMIRVNVRRTTIFPTTVLFCRNGKNVRITSNRGQFGTMFVTLVGRVLVRLRTLFVKLNVITIQRSTNPYSKRPRTLRARLNGRNSILFVVIVRIGNFVTKVVILIITLRRFRPARHRQRTVQTGQNRVRNNGTLTTYLPYTLTLINDNNATPRGVFKGATRGWALPVLVY